MILHSINKYAEAVQQPVPVLYVPPVRNAARFDKLGYAAFLSGLPFKKGSIIRNRWIDIQVLTPKALFVVKDIQEIHYLCEHGEKEPKCLLVENDEGTNFWTEPYRWLTISVGDYAIVMGGDGDCS